MARGPFARALAWLLSVTLLAIAACGGGGGGGDGGGSSGPDATTPGPAVRIRLDPGAPQIAIGQYVTITALAVDAQGRVIPNQPIQVEQSDPTVAKFESSDRETGLYGLTALAEGRTVLTFTLGTLTATATLTVVRPDIQLVGRVLDGRTQQPIAGAQVGADAAGPFVVTGADGGFSMTLPGRLQQYEPYVLLALRSGYATTQMTFVPRSLPTQGTPPTATLPPFLLVPDDGAGRIVGTVRDSANNAPIANASVLLLKGQVAPGLTGTTTPLVRVAEVTADGNGAYSFVNVPAGTYTVNAFPSNYFQCNRTAFTIAASETLEQDVSCSSSSGNEVRIVLTWGQSPADLDAHLTGPLEGSTDRFHVYYPSDSRGSAVSSPFATLDVDDRSAFGPETVTIAKAVGGVYRYSVHDFSNRASATSDSLSRSGAKVELYSLQLGSDPQVFYVPPGAGTLWTVFELTWTDGMPVVRIINEMGIAEDAASVR